MVNGWASAEKDMRKKMSTTSEISIKMKKFTGPRDREYSRILTAAVVNEKFRNLLLSNPAVAIKAGFGGEAFHLAEKDSERIAMIRAKTLADFAAQMNNYLS
jgi:hypothetical protein